MCVTFYLNGLLYLNYAVKLLKYKMWLTKLKQLNRLYGCSKVNMTTADYYGIESNNIHLVDTQ